MPAAPLVMPAQAGIHAEIVRLPGRSLDDAKQVGLPGGWSSRPVMKAFTSRWFISFVGVALMAALVWFYAPLVPQLEGGLIRLIIILMLLLVWGCANLLLDLRRERRDAALAKGIAVTDGTEASEEAEALRNKLTQALALLKKALGGRGYLYEQPWYAIIGPPGAGKTTALLNSGLRFPLAEKMGHGAVAGVGGTRLCDWWFSDEAVLIDTAGRYTTQDSNAAVDRAGWDAFLDLLKQTRPNQPLNGLLVASPLSDIALAPAAERLAHAAAIRRRSEGNGGPPRAAHARLCAVHQGRSDCRIRRILR